MAEQSETAVAWRFRYPLLSAPGEWDAWSSPMAQYPAGAESEGAEIQPLYAHPRAEALSEQILALLDAGGFIAPGKLDQARAIILAATPPADTRG